MKISFLPYTFLFIFFYSFSFVVIAQTNAELMEQMKQLQKRMNKVENKGKKKNGLKVKDFGGETTNSPANKVKSSRGSQIPETKMKEILESLKKGDAYMKERDKLLKELDDEE